MHNHPNNYQLLIDKLDEFIRKYYKNRLIKGGIYSVGIVLLFYIAVTALEYYAHFGTAIRTFLFYSFILINGFILTKLVIIPLTYLYKLGSIISHEQAAEIIGRHFTEVKDKLLNTLQLKQLTQHQTSNIKHQTSLIEASIDQKISELKPIPFTSAIDLSKNRKYLKYAVIPILLIGIVVFTAPSIITDSTKRLVEHRTYFEKTAPFEFVIQNANLKTVQQEDFELKVKLTGDEIPQNVFIEIGNNQHRLKKKSTVAFQYLFKNVQKNTSFRLFADGFYSREYNLTALPNPIVLNFETLLKYPKYLRKKDDVLQNTGDIIIPTGTKVTWNFTTKNTDVLKMSFSGENPSFFMLKPTAENEYSYTGRFFKNTSYAIKTANEYLKNKESIAYSINVIPDLYPGIDVEEHRDSSSLKRYYFTGMIKDDYGFKKLAFKTRFLPEKPDKVTSTDIAINKNLTQNQFFYFWDISKLDIQAGDEIEYYFEVWDNDGVVWDNDGVNGSKSTRSQKRIFKAPTLKEIAENAAKKNEKTKTDLEENIRKAQELQKEIKELNRALLDKKTLTWEEKKKIQDMLDAQKELQKSVRQMQQDISRNFSQQSEFKQVNENILEKQRQLEELFEKIMTDEMKELFRKMEDLLDKMDKSKVQEMLEKMKLSNKDIEKELERTLEIFKQLEFEQKLEETIEKLDELAKKEETLSEESSEKSADSKELKKEQEKLNADFQDVKKDLNDLEQKNDELEYPNDIIDTEDDENSIQEDMQESSDIFFEIGFCFFVFLSSIFGNLFKCRGLKYPFLRTC